MQIIEILALDNGAHRNQNGDFRTIPEGWAVVACDTPNFPFGTPTVEEVNGVMTVTAWEAGEIPEPEPMPEPEPTIDERITDLEEALAQTDETAIALFEAQEEQNEINAAQDDALIELYEMIGG